MTKESGLGAGLLIDAYDLSGDVGQVQEIGGGPAALDVTALNKSAIERIGGRRDGRLTFTSFFNPAAAHPVLAALPTGDVIATYLHRSTLDAPAASLQARQIDYAGTRANDGGFTFAVDLESDGYGLQWGHLRTAGLITVTGTGNQTSVHDVAASTTFGAQMFVHLTAFTGTNISFNLQHSDDDGGGDAYTTVLSGTLSAVGASRLATTSGATIKQWTRLNLSGTFTSATLTAVFVRNLTSTAF